MEASEKGYSKIVQKLLDNIHIDATPQNVISKKNMNGETALSLARKYKRDEVVAILENFLTGA